MATIEMTTDLARMITSVLSIGLGGTGQNTAKAGFNALGAGLSIATGNFTDTTYFITTNTSGATNDYSVRSYAILKSNLKTYLAPYIINSITTSGSGNAVTSASLSADGVLTLTKGSTYNNYSLPLAANGTRGGIQIGYSESGSNYAVKLSSEKAYVTVPWTNTTNVKISTTTSLYYLLGYTSSSHTTGVDTLYCRTTVKVDTSGYLYADRVYSAVWNDYAETREINITEPGRVVTETGKQNMVLANQRLLPGCKIISDTYGICMGDNKNTPIAVAGRVLAYPYQDKNNYKPGDAVCSAPNGTVDIMTRDEIMMYPERIVGTVSEIPDYDVWYANNENNTAPVQVNNRIWIYVR